MERRKNQHVIRCRTGWAVRGEGNNKNTAVVRFKLEAIFIARRIAINQKSELLIHNKGGEIVLRDSYGNDPFPNER